jgi:hypothetical protein
MKHLVLAGLLPLGVLLVTCHQAQAQRAGSPVHSVVDEFPHLPTGGGTPALEEALARGFRYPGCVSPRWLNGVVYVDVTVSLAGKVTAVQLERSHLKNCGDSLALAVEQAVRRLPTLVPAQLSKRAVNVVLHLGWFFDQTQYTKVWMPEVHLLKERSEFDISNPTGQDGATPLSDASPEDNRVYSYVEQEASLPGGGGTAAIIAAVQQALVVPADAEPGKVFVDFVVTQQGDAVAPHILKGLSTSTDEAVLAAVRRLPRLLPGKMNGRAVRVHFTLPITISPPPGSKPAVPKH